MSEKIPDECPDIEKCEESMFQCEYDHFCTTHAWLDCPELSNDTKEMVKEKFKKKAREWKKHGSKG